MDLNDFFSNVSRIAVALETIARNGTPTDYNLIRDVITRRGPQIDTAGTEGRTQPKALMEAVKEAAPDLNPAQVAHVVGTMAAVEEDLKVNLAPKAEDHVSPAVERIHKAMKEAFANGITTANGLANEMVKRGIPHPRPIKWNNLSAKPFMDQLGLSSTYAVRGGRKPQTQAAPKPEAAKEPAPEPEPRPVAPAQKPEPAAKGGSAAAPEPGEPVAERRVSRAFVEREFKQRRTDDAHMNLRGLLSPKTQARLEAHEKAQAADRALIDAAIAAGRVTKLPACTDSEGLNHLEESGSGVMRTSGPSFGPNSGSRVQARGSMS